MDKKNLSEEEKLEITNEVLNRQPPQEVGLLILLEFSKHAVEKNAAEIKLATEATIKGSRYKCEMVITCKKIKPVKIKKSSL